MAALDGPVDGVPLEAFLDTLRRALAEARRRIRERREAAFAAELAALQRNATAGAAVFLLPPVEGAGGDDERLAFPKRCLTASPYLQVSSLSLEFPVQVATGDPAFIELLDRGRAAAGDAARLVIRLEGDDPIAGTVTINDRPWKEF